MGSWKSPENSRDYMMGELFIQSHFGRLFLSIYKLASFLSNILRINMLEELKDR